MPALLELSPNVFINPERISAIEPVVENDIPKTAVYVEGKVFIVDGEPRAVVSQLKQMTADNPTQYWAGR